VWPLLPDILPGALPQLQQLSLQLASLHTTLPSSWGAPGVLPSLRRLSLHAHINGWLPPEWGGGFPRLEHIELVGPSPQLREASPSQRLPPEWGRGFPALQSLHLAHLVLGGTIPSSWLQGFSSLTKL